MKFVKPTTGLGEILVARLHDALQSNQRVIWLVSGGSNIDISVHASQLLDETLSKKLIVMQSDERFVAFDSPDCNWHQLLEHGFITKQATLYPILSTKMDSLDTTATRYNDVVEREFALADCIVGQFGIGSDGHIAGIKPLSTAATSRASVEGYQAEDFSRITLTFPALKRVTYAETFAFGAAKRPVLTALLGDSPPLEVFPAGILKTIAVSTIYNDQIESQEGTS